MIIGLATFHHSLNAIMVRSQVAAMVQLMFDNVLQKQFYACKATSILKICPPLESCTVISCYGHFLGAK